MGVWVVAHVQYVQHRRPYMAPTLECNDYNPPLLLRRAPIWWEVWVWGSVHGWCSKRVIHAMLWDVTG